MLQLSIKFLANRLVILFYLFSKTKCWHLTIIYYTVGALLLLLQIHTTYAYTLSRCTPTTTVSDQACIRLRCDGNYSCFEKQSQAA